MKIQRIEFKHTGPFLNFSLDFQTQPAVTLLYAAPGVGKTQFLKHIFHALTWLPARLKDIRTAGVAMLDQDISLQRIQSKIEIVVEFPQELGTLPISSNQQESSTQHCRWQLYKTLNAESIGISRAETLELEQLADLYRKVTKADPLQGLPFIAFYPSTRFINEINLLSKNAPTTFHPHSAYDIATVPFFTFSKFFEWLREVSDLENAQTAQLLQRLLNAPHPFEQIAEFKQQLLDAERHAHAPHLHSFQQAVYRLFPEISQIYLQYLPKLSIQVCYQQKMMRYQQLPNAIRTWIALIGDVVRRACLLNPKSPHPCQDVEGILLIDEVDLGLADEQAMHIIEQLHQLFPQLQFIFTTSRSQILELERDYQMLHLQPNAAHPLQSPQHRYHDWYGTLHEDTTEHVEHLHEQSHTAMEYILAKLPLLSSDEQDSLFAWLTQQRRVDHPSASDEFKSD